VIGRVVVHCITKCLGVKSDGMSMLVEDNSRGVIRCISFYFEGLR